MIDKSKMRTANGVPFTQSLFLEFGYTDAAVYTTKDEDHEYKGKVYPSLKRLYLEMMDPTEYEFANTYLLGWDHWQRIINNKLMTNKVKSWRRELEMKIRSMGVKKMIEQAQKGDRAAARWLAEKGFDKRSAGRPTKDELDREIAFEKQIASDYGADIIRLRED